MVRRRTKPTYGRGPAGPILVIVALGVATAGGCRERGREPRLEEPSISVIELGRIGGHIYNEPDRSHEILEEAGMTPEEFEARVSRISRDPRLAREYTAGFEAVARPPVVDTEYEPLLEDSVLPEPADSTPRESH